jgi:DNA-binding LacI/PurR family transcriptional regulator
VALPHRELATEAVRLLLSAREPGDREIRLPMPLRLRESVAAPSAGR